MSPQPTYDALRHGTARVPRIDRGVIRLGGADRAAWLQGLVTNDVRALEPGHRIYAAWLTPQGRMLTDLWIVDAGDALLLDVPAPLAASLAARLDGLIFAEDVQVDDVSGRMACTTVVGASGPPAASPSGVVALDATFGRPGLAIYGEADTVLAAHGLAALADLPVADLAALEILRVEAGVPRFLVDMTGETIPLEAGIEHRAISFTKGCYVGQELIVRVTQRGGGRVAKKLVGLVLDEDGAVAADSSSVAAADDRSPEAPLPAAPAGFPIRVGERAIGQLTSLARSPLVGRRIALGYVHRDFVGDGTAVTVDLASGPVAATVRALPLVPAQSPA